MDGVDIERLTPAGPKDNRGHTLQWKFENGYQITVFTRKKGVRFGGHYHTGDDPSKNPERFLLLAGRMKIICADGNTEETHIIQPGETLTVYPYIYHEAEALEECMFIEFRVTHFDPDNSDTYNVSKKAFLKEIKP